MTAPVSGRRRRRTGARVVTIFWRDIPAQVNGQAGSERHRVILSAKFQRAIDRAKRKAGITTAADDVAQWRRETSACDDIVAAAQATAARLEADYDTGFLGRLAYVGGFVSDLDRPVGTDRADAAEPVASEEPDEPTTTPGGADD